jgi:hypothetical protein
LVIIWWNKKKYYFMSYRPNGSRHGFKPDTNLYTIVLRIYPNGLGTNRIENKVKFDNNIRINIMVLK